MSSFLHHGHSRGEVLLHATCHVLSDLLTALETCLLINRGTRHLMLIIEWVRRVIFEYRGCRLTVTTTDADDLVLSRDQVSVCILALSECLIIQTYL